MKTVEINLSELTEEQLAALKLINPRAYEAEKIRRNCYSSIYEGMDEVVELGQKLEQHINSRKQSPFIKEFARPLVTAIARLQFTRLQHGE